MNTDTNIIDKRNLSKFIYDSLSEKEKTKLITGRNIPNSPLLEHAKQCWWSVSNTNNSHYMLTKKGHSAFIFVNIKNYDTILSSDNIISATLLRRLQSHIKNPFFISNKNNWTNEINISLFSEKDYFLLKMYGNNLSKMMDHMSKND